MNIYEELSYAETAHYEAKRQAEVHRRNIEETREIEPRATLGVILAGDRYFRNELVAGNELARARQAVRDHEFQLWKDMPWWKQLFN